MGPTGLCGSDLHYYAHGANGSFKIQAPMVLGHESCGIITALPESEDSAASGLKVGDRVALEVGISCRLCQFCQRGRYNLCSKMRFASSAKTFPHLDGTLCEVMNHPVHLVHKLPEGMDLTLAALAEPLSVVLHAYRRARMEPGARVLVLGAGAVGLLACALAKASGATTVVVVDIEEEKLKFAKEMGWADEVFCLPKGARVSGAESLEVAKKNWEGLRESPAVQETLGLEDGFDAVFECTGVETCMQMACFVSVDWVEVLISGFDHRWKSAVHWYGDCESPSARRHLSHSRG